MLQVERLTGKLPRMAFVDRGYRGHWIPEERSRVFISGTRKLGNTLKRQLRRRSAVEPEIGHMNIRPTGGSDHTRSVVAPKGRGPLARVKNDGLLGRNFLKGVQGDAMNALLCGAGHNLRKILARMRAFLCLLFGDARVAIQGLIAHIAGLRFHQPALKTARIGM